MYRGFFPSWLQPVNSGDSGSLSELRRLETQAMRRWLARRRYTVLLYCCIMVGRRYSLYTGDSL